MSISARLEIFFDVLKIIESGEDKSTRIMYGTNISWITLHDIIDILHENGFIEVRKKGRAKRYYISDKGRRALSNFRRSIEGLATFEINSE